MSLLLHLSIGRSAGIAEQGKSGEGPYAGIVTTRHGGRLVKLASTVSGRCIYGGSGLGVRPTKMDLLCGGMGCLSIGREGCCFGCSLKLQAIDARVSSCVAPAQPAWTPAEVRASPVQSGTFHFVPPFGSAGPSFCRGPGEHRILTSSYDGSPKWKLTEAGRTSRCDAGPSYLLPEAEIMPPAISKAHGSAGELLLLHLSGRPKPAVLSLPNSAKSGGDSAFSLQPRAVLSHRPPAHSQPRPSPPPLRKLLSALPHNRKKAAREHLNDHLQTLIRLSRTVSRDCCFFILCSRFL